MSFLNYISKAQIEFEDKLGRKPTMILIPYWRIKEILDNNSYTNIVQSPIYLKKQRIDGLIIIWTYSQDFIELI